MYIHFLHFGYILTFIILFVLMLALMCVLFLNHFLISFWCYFDAFLTLFWPWFDPIFFNAFWPIFTQKCILTIYEYNYPWPPGWPRCPAWWSLRHCCPIAHGNSPIPFPIPWPVLRRIPLGWVCDTFCVWGACTRCTWSLADPAPISGRGSKRKRLAANE